MPRQSLLRRLFLANATVLVTHQIDAAYWHEWKLFLIPGGNQVNLLLNIPIIALVMYAHSRVVANFYTGIAFHKLLAGLGFLTVGIHSFFLLNGNESFRQTVSVLLLVATFVLSAWQLIALRGLRKSAVLSQGGAAMCNH